MFTLYIELNYHVESLWTRKNSYFPLQEWIQMTYLKKLSSFLHPMSVLIQRELVDFKDKKNTKQKTQKLSKRLGSDVYDFKISVEITNCTLICSVY